jgi:hypothetical protein
MLRKMTPESIVEDAIAFDYGPFTSPLGKK